MTKLISRACYTLLILLFIVACSHWHSPAPSPGNSDLAVPLGEIIPNIKPYKVILIGESHDRYDHHLNQLAVIKQLYRDNPAIVIAMEFFQQPFQYSLDAYIAGTIDEREMLNQTEYFSRWGYDYRLYSPILRFARDNKIPLLALNVPTEITRQTARKGLVSLSEEQKQQIPEFLDRSKKGYNKRITRVYAMHGQLQHTLKVQNFLDAQLLWDEGMAERAASYLQENPDRQMILLAGSGHIAYRDGIPERLERRLGMPVVTLLNVSAMDRPDTAMADFFIRTQRQDLIRQGIMGIEMSEDQQGLFVHALDEQGAARTAGILPGDRIEKLQGQRVYNRSDVKLAMWNSEPGDVISIHTSRDSLKGQTQSFTLKLQ